MSAQEDGWVHGHRVAAQSRQTVQRALEQARKRRKNWIVRFLWSSRRKYLDAFIRRLQLELEQR